MSDSPTSVPTSLGSTPSATPTTPRGTPNVGMKLDQENCVGAQALLLHCLFKEVIQPQVPLRLPCYDFTPVTNHTVASALRS